MSPRDYIKSLEAENKQLRALLADAQIKSSGQGHHWVDGACGYCVCSANSKLAACRNALALISRKRKAEIQQ